MNMSAKGTINCLGKNFNIDTSDDNSNWSINFNDLSGIFPHKTHLSQVWMQHPRKLREKYNKIEPDRLAFYSLSGLQLSEHSRAEVDWTFVDDWAEAFEPTLHWPTSLHEIKDQWDFNTHLEGSYSYSKIQSSCWPEHTWQRYWDVLAVREWEA